MDAKLTLPLLDEFEKLGFGDDAFAQVHHFRAEGRRETISGFRKYCLETDNFIDGQNNERTYRRLEKIVAAYQASKRPATDHEFFRIVADNWFRNLPPS
jgi:hypothetical protein